MTNTIKILALADIHQRDFKWSKLVSAARKEQPDIIIVSGDLVINAFMFKYKEFVENTIRKCAEEIKKYCPYLIIIPGNDDNGDLSDYLLTAKGADDLWYNAHNRIIKANGLEFAGVPYVVDHPFGYKYWSVRETDENLKINPLQLCRPLTSVKESKNYIDIENYAQFLKDRPSMETILKELSLKITDMDKAVFLIHCPPMGCGLDISSHGDVCGSESVTKFIMDKQPLLTIHGHIHESPHYTNRWCCQLNKTWSIQAGQIENDLYYSIIYIQDGHIIGLSHSVYGEYKG